MTIQAILEKLYPPGVYGGQCGTFAHKVVKFPSVGDSIWAKRSAVKKYGIKTPQVGDILITSESVVFGHVAIINADLGDRWGITESNFYLDLRVRHNRTIAKNSSAIIGAILGVPKYPVPNPYKIIHIPLCIIMNQPDWKTLTQHATNLRKWFWEQSNYRIILHIDYQYTSFTKWDTHYTGSYIGGMNVEVITPYWFNKNVTPIASNGFPNTTSKINLFVMARKDWKGTVFNHPELMELGYAYQWDWSDPASTKLPMQAMLVADEHDDYYPYYPEIGAFAKLAAHEIMHLLYRVCANVKVVKYGDYTHVHAYGEQGKPIQLKDCFADLDLDKLQKLIG